MYEISVEDYTQIIKVRFKGNYGIDEIEAYHKKLTTISLPERVLIIEDYRDAIPDLCSCDLEKLVEISTKTLPIKKNFRIAFISDSPISMALAHVVGDRLNSETFNHKAFSSEEAARKWLMEY